MYKKILLAILFSFSLIFAQNYEDCINPLWYFQNFGSSNGALANNSTTLTSGMSGLASNPATLGQQRNMLIGISFRNNNMSQDSKFVNSNDLTSSNYNNSALMKTNLDGISGIFPIPVYRGSLVFAFSYSQVANYFDQAEANGNFMYDDSPYIVDNTFEKTGTMNATRLGIAFEYQKNLFIGTSLNYYRGKQIQDYSYVDHDISDNFSYSSINKVVEVNPEYSGINFNIGLLYLTENFKFGTNLSTPFILHVEEEYKNSEKWTYDDGVVETEKSSDEIKYKIKSPSAVSAGIEYRLGGISLLFDVKMQDWHNMNFDSKLTDSYYDDDGNLDYTESTDTRINSEIRNNLKTTFDYGFGLSTRFYNNYKFNLGHRVITLPYYDLPNSDKYVHLTGLGIETQVIDNLHIGLSYQFEYGKSTINKEYFEYPIYRKYNSQNFVITTSFIF